LGDGWPVVRWTTAVYLGFSALSPGLRQQMRSINSLYWTFTFPWSAGCIAFLAVAMRLVGIKVFLSGRSTGKAKV
jgi:hypothetical protein